MAHAYTGSADHDLFFQTGMSAEVENLKRYTRDKFHPVTLGQVLPQPGTCADVAGREPRYRIMVKTGFSPFSTVWLARDLDEHQWIAIKICSGTETPQRSKEVAVLFEIRETGRGKAGFEQILKLFDSFKIKGPNGFHECIVTEVVASLDDMDVRWMCSIDAVRPIMQGSAFLHEQGISHGDPHIGNFGVALPQLDQIDEEDIASEFPTKDLIPVMPRHDRIPRATLPACAAASESLAFWLKSGKVFPGDGQLQLKILDFGRAHRTIEEVATLKGAVPPMVRPPEALMHDMSKGSLGCAWSQAADVWAVACTTCHILGRGQLFDGTWSHLDRCLLECLELGGPPIEASDFIKSNTKPSPNRHCTDREKAWEKQAESSRCKGEQCRVFFDLLKKMLVTDPEKRISMQEALAHPFFDYQELLRPPPVDEAARIAKPPAPVEDPMVEWAR